MVLFSWKSFSFAQNYSISWCTFGQGGKTGSSDNYGLQNIITYGPADEKSSSENYVIISGYLLILRQISFNLYTGSNLKIYSFPNPFNPLKEKVKIKYFLPGKGNVDVSIKIYNLAGELIKEIDEGRKEKGYSYFIDWDGKNKADNMVANGIYLCLIEAENHEICKIAVIK